MKIISKHAYVWPHVGFSLKAGENVVDEADIPLAIHGKLEHLSKLGTELRTEQDPEGKPFTREVKVPGPISGYDPSPEFIAAAEKHNPKRAIARMPKVATLRTAKAAPAPQAQPEPGKGK